MISPTAFSNLRRVVAALRGVAAVQIPVVLSPRQYVWVAFGACVLINILLGPTRTGFGANAKLAMAGKPLGLVVGVILIVIASNYLLRYSNNPVRRWLDQRPLWQNVLLRLCFCVAALAAYGLLRYHFNVQEEVPGRRSLRLAQLYADGPRRRPQLPMRSVSATLVYARLVLVIEVVIEALERSIHLGKENQLLKQAHLQARYEGLKQQLSPHFLFNSLSTLRGLIDDAPAEAGRFVEEMSRVYRYLLQHREHTTVSLQEELTFLQSYVFLLQMRFGESLQVEVTLPEYREQLLERQLPPLALQLLVENAVKHNILTRQHPLRVHIGFRAPDTLVVRNNRQPRLTPEPSSGIGLSNLTNRIRLLHHQELLVEQLSDEFRVYVPLPF